MKRFLPILFVLIASSQVYAKWAHIGLDELIASSDLIVIGTLHSAVEGDEGIGSGLIRIGRVVAGDVLTVDGRRVRAGDELKITWQDNWACAAGMHRRRANEEAIWLLEVEKDGTVGAGYPGRFRPQSELAEVTKLLRRLRLDRTDERVDVLLPFSESPEPLFVSEPRELLFAVHGPRDMETSLMRGVLVGVAAFGLYFILYRSRFRIR